MTPEGPPTVPAPSAHDPKTEIEPPVMSLYSVSCQTCATLVWHGDTLVTDNGQDLLSAYAESTCTISDCPHTPEALARAAAARPEHPDVLARLAALEATLIPPTTTP